jgi:pyruvate dehydrogenase E1 component
VPRERVYRVLGTDGFGRSDSRAKLREFFEVNRHFVTVAALQGARASRAKASRRRSPAAIAKYGIDPEKRDPTTV